MQVVIEFFLPFSHFAQQQRRRRRLEIIISFYFYFIIFFLLTRETFGVEKKIN